MSPDLTDTAVRRHLYIAIAQRRVRPGTGSSRELLFRRTWRSPVFPLGTITHIPFVVVGGVATRLYAPERMTDDLDVLVAAEDAEQFYTGLSQVGCQRLGLLAIPGSTWRLPDGTLLDVLEAEDPWVRKALEDPAVAPDGLPVIRLPYLVLLKIRAGRATDIADISRMLGGVDDAALDPVRAAVTAYQPDALEDLNSLVQLGRLEYEASQGGRPPPA